MKKIITLILIIASTEAISSDKWFSMSRHGDCAPLSMLAEKIDEFKGVQTPSQLVQSYNKSGHKAVMKDFRELMLNESENTKEALKAETPPEGTVYQIIIDGRPQWLLLEESRCKQVLSGPS
ncbi:hypothetical protein [Photobacterium kasasachensis]|uniref:hypothetical protein n=1 Tax=Photobacterium kasasachensis TaxID=2910240 RepID=UPI003D13C27B